MKLLGRFVCVAVLAHETVARAGDALPTVALTNITALRTLVSGANIQIIEGYAAAGDGGGGSFYSSLTPAGLCTPQTITTTGWVSNSTTIALKPSAKLGMNIVATTSEYASIPAYDQIVNNNGSSLSTIVLASPTTGSAITGTTLVIGCDNGGSAIVNVGTSASSSGYIYTRQSPSYSPREFGAELGSTDDTFPLEQWLAANQPHIALPGTSYVESMVICPPGAAFQGPVSTGVDEDTSILPPFVIAAGASFSGAAVLLMPANQSCAMHSVGIIGPSAGVSDGVDAMGKSDLIDQHSYIQGGYYNVFAGAGGTGGAANLEIYDSSLVNAFNINADINTPNVKLVRNSFAGSGKGAPATPTKITGSASGTGGSAILQFASALSGVVPGMTVSGASGLPADAVVASAVGNTVTLTQAAIGGIMDSVTLVSPSGENIKFTSTDGLISNNIIQQGTGWGLLVSGARSVRVGNNYFDNNGKGVIKTGAVEVSNSGNVTVCGNTFTENALATEIAVAATPGLTPAHVVFDGTDDSVAFCGNVYLPLVSSGDNTATNSTAASVLLRPDYVYDMTAGAMLTNFTINDNTAIQNIGVLSPHILSAMPTGFNPMPSITGLTFPNSGMSSSVTIAPGQATDSTGQVLINMPTLCTINLSGPKGANGLDTGTLTSGATYDIYVYAGLGGNAPGCIASTFTTGPSFFNVASPPLTLTAFGTAAAADNLIFDIGPSPGIVVNNLVANPLAGMTPGDAVVINAGGNIATTTLLLLQPFNVTNVVGSIIAGGVHTTCIPANDINNLGTFKAVMWMSIAGGGIPNNTTINATGTNDSMGSSCATGFETIGLSNISTAATTTFSIGGGFSMFVNSVSPTGVTPVTLTVMGGLSRLVGQYHYTGM